MVQDRGADDGIERLIAGELLESRFDKLHLPGRQIPSPRFLQQLSRQVHRHDSGASSGEKIGEHSCAAADLQDMALRAHSSGIGDQIGPAGRAPLSCRRTPAPGKFRVVRRQADPMRHLAVRPRFFPVICKHEGIVRRRRSGVNTETPDPAFDKVGRHCISWWRFPNPWPDGDRWPACSRRRRGGNDASAEREFAFRARTECEQGRQRIASRRREHRPAQMLPAITKRKAPGREKGAMPSGSKKRARDAAARRVT